MTFERAFFVIFENLSGYRMSNGF